MKINVIKIIDVFPSRQNILKGIFCEPGRNAERLADRVEYYSAQISKQQAEQIQADLLKTGEMSVIPFDFGTDFRAALAVFGLIEKSSQKEADIWLAAYNDIQANKDMIIAASDKMFFTVYQREKQKIRQSAQYPAIMTDAQVSTCIIQPAKKQAKEYKFKLYSAILSKYNMTIVDFEEIRKRLRKTPFSYPEMSHTVFYLEKDEKIKNNA